MGAHCNYPWVLWTNGSKWTLRHGRDFTSTIATFIRHVNTKAAELKRHVSIRKRGKNVTVQFGAHRAVPEVRRYRPLSG